MTSTLTDLITRFTNYNQFEKTAEFVLDAPLTVDEKTSLTRALLQNRHNIEWDRRRLPEIERHIGAVRRDDVNPPINDDDDDTDGDDDGLAWWAWLLIVLGVVAGVLIVGGGGWWAYGKYFKGT